MATEWTIDTAKKYIIDTLEYWEKVDNFDKIKKIADFTERGRIAGEGKQTAFKIKGFDVVIRSLGKDIEKLKDLDMSAPTLEGTLLRLQEERNKLIQGYTPNVRTKKVLKTVTEFDSRKVQRQKS
jgi:hypothetical protein